VVRAGRLECWEAGKLKYWDTVKWGVLGALKPGKLEKIRSFLFF
jgi:hypothetical protein